VSRDRKRDRIAPVPEAEAREIEEWLRAEETRHNKHADFEFGDRWFLTPAIEDGDWDALEDYRKRGHPETPAMGEFINKILRVEVKRRREGKPRRATILWRDLVIAAVAFGWKQRDGKNYIQKTLDELGLLDPQEVHRARKRWPTLDKEVAELALVMAGKRERKSPPDLTPKQ
jgi:hypothetical protein